MGIKKMIDGESVLARDGLLKEIRYISQSGVKEYEFKEHYNYDFIAGRVKKEACDYINRRIHYYFSSDKKEARKEGWYVAGLPYKKLMICDLDEFFDLDVTRENGTDKVVMHVKDMSEDCFKEIAQNMFYSLAEHQGERFPKVEWRRRPA